jgi:hypothetical protein
MEPGLELVLANWLAVLGCLPEDSLQLEEGW